MADWAWIGGNRTQQEKQDLPIWEEVLSGHPVELLVELGTGNGAFSGWLAGLCDQRDIEFLSFDRNVPFLSGPWFHHVNLLDQSEKIIERFRHPMLLWCDNGDKPREVELYAPFLERGDILAVHDWDTEISQADIPDRFTHLAGEHMTRWFVHA